MKLTKQICDKDLAQSALTPPPPTTTTISCKNNIEWHCNAQNIK